MSLSFLLAVSLICALFYYVCPSRFRWFFLLLSSIAIYAHAGWQGIPFLLLTAGATWISALAIDAFLLLRKLRRSYKDAARILSFFGKKKMR